MQPLELGDDGRGHLAAAPGRADGDRRQFAAAVAVRFDLTASDEALGRIDGHNKPAPIQLGGVDSNAQDEGTDPARVPVRCRSKPDPVRQSFH